MDTLSLDGLYDLRMPIALGTLLFFGTLEFIIPKRHQLQNRLVRWFSNFGILIIGAIFVEICLPFLGKFFPNNDQGLFLVLDLPWEANIFFTILCLDLIIYFQHRIFHRVPMLWRLHRVHHTDRTFDFTTAYRFHPLEILISMTIKLAAVYYLGCHPIGFLIFEMLLNSSAVFNHSNISLGSLDKYLQSVLVTPDMHRIHHSVFPRETNSNYGFFLSLWDHLFRSFTAQARQDQTTMKIGLKEFRDPKEDQLHNLLLQPFRKSN